MPIEISYTRYRMALECPFRWHARYFGNCHVYAPQMDRLFSFGQKNHLWARPSILEHIAGLSIEWEVPYEEVVLGDALFNAHIDYVAFDRQTLLIGEIKSSKKEIEKNTTQLRFYQALLSRYYERDGVAGELCFHTRKSTEYLAVDPMDMADAVCLLQDIVSGYLDATSRPEEKRPGTWCESCPLCVEEEPNNDDTEATPDNNQRTEGYLREIAGVLPEKGLSDRPFRLTRDIRKIATSADGGRET